jgi:hypothetical protein
VVSFSPEATHAEVLRLYPAALAAEPVYSTPNIGQAVPLTADKEAAIRSWLVNIGEGDLRIVDETVERCRQDASAQAYFLGRARQGTKAEPFDREGEAVEWHEDDRRR